MLIIVFFHGNRHWCSIYWTLLQNITIPSRWWSDLHLLHIYFITFPRHCLFSNCLSISLQIKKIKCICSFIPEHFMFIFCIFQGMRFRFFSLQTRMIQMRERDRSEAASASGRDYKRLVALPEPAARINTVDVIPSHYGWLSTNHNDNGKEELSSAMILINYCHSLGVINIQKMINRLRFHLSLRDHFCKLQYKRLQLIPSVWCFTQAEHHIRCV